MWVKTVSSTFKDLDFEGRYNHSLAVDSIILAAKNYLIVGKHVVSHFCDTTNHC